MCRCNFNDGIGDNNDDYGEDNNDHNGDDKNGDEDDFDDFPQIALSGREL